MRRSLILLVATLVMVLPLGPLGCGKKNKPKAADPAPVAKAPEPEPKPAEAPKEEPKKEPEVSKLPPKAKIRGGSVVRRVDVVDVMFMMKNIDIATKNFQAERNRYPNSREELETYYEKNGKINQAFKEGDLVYMWKATRVEEPDKTILAYEGQSDTNGIRVVLLANGEPKQVDEAEFNSLAKMPTKK